jgi:hypothetical protein
MDELQHTIDQVNTPASLQKRKKKRKEKYIYITWLAGVYPEVDLLPPPLPFQAWIQ